MFKVKDCLKSCLFYNNKNNHEPEFYIKVHMIFHSALSSLWMSWTETKIYLLSVSLLCKYPALALKNFNRPEHKACAWMSGAAEWSFNYEG